MRLLSPATWWARRAWKRPTTSCCAGEDGSRDVIVDSHGREVGILGTQHAKPGQDLKLTIDIDLQRAAEMALGDTNGAVVAMDPRNGEILALVSHPSYDPNAFAVRIHRDEWNKLITDPRHPLMNKAIQDQLAPGSTFKIIMSAAGMQEGDRPEHARELRGRRRLLRALLQVRQAPRGAGHPRSHSAVVRYVLLHHGAAAGDRHIAKYATAFGCRSGRASTCPMK